MINKYWNSYRSTRSQRFEIERVLQSEYTDTRDHDPMINITDSKYATTSKTIQSLITEHCNAKTTDLFRERAHDSRI